ncbi:LysR family transcriptional regulator [Marinomonas sp. C2222]|uniref:LysR family transcriptional regulator n=1 Tax=Marinomonas sargassi TaxID=2984494 RepID=A0ABT2YUG1_9GAMM|nr:LysR family transcriptional regulator [Marinomonas sargassi]MCV2403545.1 LysR family transcriptional regulator [Marinomonas sargassi]
MNIEHLRLFVRIARTQNISQAGQELDISAAVASNYINKLERELGVRLVHRTTRKVSLTEDGADFLPHAEDVLSSVEAARASVGAGNASPTGKLRITVPSSFGRMHLMPAMKGFMEAYPKLEVDCRFSDSIVDLVEGGFDVAIRNAQLKSSSLIARKLATDTRVVCASPDYIRLHGQPKTPKDLRDHQCISLAGFEHWQFDTPEGKQTIKVHGNFRADHGEAVKDACVQGLGLTICSTWIAYEELRKGSLVKVLTDFPLVSETDIWAVYPSSRQLAPKVRAFIDYFSSVYGTSPYWDK